MDDILSCHLGPPHWTSAPRPQNVGAALRPPAPVESAARARRPRTAVLHLFSRRALRIVGAGLAPARLPGYERGRAAWCCKGERGSPARGADWGGAGGRVPSVVDRDCGRGTRHAAGPPDANARPYIEDAFENGTANT